jgi:hypothetical protein
MKSITRKVWNKNREEENNPMMGMEEVEKIKDAEVAFLESKVRDMEALASTDDELEDRASKENLSRRSKRKAAKTPKEEKENKEIMMGS